MGNLTPREMEKLLRPVVGGQVEILVKPDTHTTILRRGEIRSVSISQGNQHVVIHLKWLAEFVDDPGAEVAWRLQLPDDIFLYPETTEFYDIPHKALKARQAKLTYTFFPAHDSHIIRPPTPA